MTVVFQNGCTNIVRVIKSRRMRWAGHVTCMGERRGVYRVLVGNLRERDHLEDDVDGRIILRWIFRKWYVGVWTGSSWLRIGKDGGQLLCLTGIYTLYGRHKYCVSGMSITVKTQLYIFK